MDDHAAASRKLASALGLSLLPVCVYGSDEKPADGIHTSAISDCVADSVFKMASGEKPFALYASMEGGASFCRCMGGPAWFGYTGFNPDLIRSMSTEAPAGFTPKNLKSSPHVAEETYAAAGKISPIGRYTIMRRCDDPGLQGCAVMTVICFGTAGQIRDLCGLAHFGSPGVLNVAEMPWGPSCATLITYPAGMASGVQADRLFLGPVDPSAALWLDPSMMVAGIPAGMAGKMAGDIERSYLKSRYRPGH